MGRRADLKTGYDCNCNCVFCVIGDKLFTGDRSTRDCLDELRASRARCEDVVFTGAEVTIRDDFFTLLAAAKKLGYRTIQVQTNGRMLAYRAFAERAVAAGANEFSPSIHGPTAKIHDALTRARGSFDQVVACIDNLVALGQRVITNTVVTPTNAPHLPALATMLVARRVAQFQLAFPHPTGHADTLFDRVVPRMSEVAPHIHAALAIGVAGGVDCMAEAMPYCMMLGHESRVAELHIPPTEIVYDGYVVPDYAEDRVGRGKRRFEQCSPCRWESICEGTWREYPQRRGSEEFSPVLGARVVDPALVLDGALEMLGSEAPPWPQPQSELPPYTALAFYPEDFSPACTAQAQGMEAGHAMLAARGVTLLGVSPDDERRHETFAAAQGLSYRLISDPEFDLARAYGVVGEAPRRTVLVDARGRIAHVITRVDTAAHAAQILAAIDKLEAPPRSVLPRDDLVVLRRPSPSSRNGESQNGASRSGA